MPMPWYSNGGGFVGNGCVGGQHLALEIGVGIDRTLLDGPHRVAGDPVEDVGEPLLAHLREGLDGPPVDGDVHQARRGRKIVVPDPLGHRLEVQHALARLHVDGDDALREQVVARPVPAVVVAGRRAGGKEDVAGLLVGAHGRPDVGVPRVAPRLVQPGVGPEVVRLRHGAEHPPRVAGAGVDALHPARRRLPADDEVGDDGRGDDDVAQDHRRRLDLQQVAPLVVHLAPVGAGDALGQVHAAARAEPGHGLPGLRVDGVQPALAGAPEDALVAALLVGPVRDAPRAVAVRRPALQVHLRVVHPAGLAGAGVEGRHLVQRRRQVQGAADHERRRLEPPDRELSEPLAQRLEVERAVGRLPAPRDAQVLEVRRVYLVQRRVLGASLVAAVGAPFAAGGAVLRRRGNGSGGQEPRGQPDDGQRRQSHDALLEIRRTSAQGAARTGVRRRRGHGGRPRSPP